MSVWWGRSVLDAGRNLTANLSRTFLCLFALPHAGEGKAIFACNLHNLGRLFERVVQLQEGRDGLYVPIGSENKDYFLRVF